MVSPIYLRFTPSGSLFSKINKKFHLVVFLNTYIDICCRFMNLPFTIPSIKQQAKSNVGKRKVQFKLGTKLKIHNTHTYIVYL